MAKAVKVMGTAWLHKALSSSRVKSSRGKGGAAAAAREEEKKKKKKKSQNTKIRTSKKEIKNKTGPELPYKITYFK